MGTGEKQWDCKFLPYDCSSRNKTDKQSNQQINKQRSLLTLTVSREKRSCLIRSKKKKQNKTKQKQILKQKKNKARKIKKRK